MWMFPELRGRGVDLVTARSLVCGWLRNLRRLKEYCGGEGFVSRLSESWVGFDVYGSGGDFYQLCHGLDVRVYTVDFLKGDTNGLL